ECREGDRHAPGPECERQHGYFGGDHQVVRMAEEPVGAPADEGGARQGDDPRGPIAAEAQEHPGAKTLQEPEENQERHGNGGPRRPGREDRDEPRRVQRDDQGIVATADLDAAGIEKRAGVAPSVPELDEPHERHQRHHAGGDRVHAASMIWKAAVKPGPIALISMRPEAPPFSMRSSMNSTVAADMLP